MEAELGCTSQYVHTHTHTHTGQYLFQGLLLHTSQARWSIFPNFTYQDRRRIGTDNDNSRPLLDSIDEPNVRHMCFTHVEAVDWLLTAHWKILLFDYSNYNYKSRAAHLHLDLLLYKCWILHQWGMSTPQLFVSVTSQLTFTNNEIIVWLELPTMSKFGYKKLTLSLKGNPT